MSIRSFLYVVLFLCLILGTKNALYAQVNWLSSFEEAQQKAFAEDKLILIDFWAIWCAPCRAMDRQLWNLPELRAISQNFVPLKIDINKNNKLKDYYKITSIPSFVIVDALGNFIWKERGFSDPGYYLHVLSELPFKAKTLNKGLLQYQKDKSSNDVQLQLGIGYQELAVQTRLPKMKQTLLKISDIYLSKVRKSGDIVLSAMAELYQYTNLIYAGKSKSALKKLQNRQDWPQNRSVQQLRQAVQELAQKASMPRG